MSVLLPQPLGPRMQDSRPERKRCEKPSMAFVPTPLPSGQIFVRSSTITSTASRTLLRRLALSGLSRGDCLCYWQIAQIDDIGRPQPTREGPQAPLKIDREAEPGEVDFAVVMHVVALAVDCAPNRSHAGAE